MPFRFYGQFIAVCLALVILGCGKSKAPTPENGQTQAQADTEAPVIEQNKRSSPPLPFELRIVSNAKTDIQYPSWRGEKTYYLGSTVLVDTRHVESATLGEDQFGKKEIDIKLTPEGTTLFKEATGANVGNRLAIIALGKVASAPRIAEKIEFGRVRVALGLENGNDARVEEVLKSILKHKPKQ